MQAPPHPAACKQARSGSQLTPLLWACERERVCMCVCVCACVFVYVSSILSLSSSSPVSIDWGDSQIIHRTLPIIPRDQHWIRPTSYFLNSFMHVCVLLCVCLCVCMCVCTPTFVSSDDSLMLSCKCIIPQLAASLILFPCVILILACLFAHPFSQQSNRWMWLMFISISWRSLLSLVFLLSSFLYTSLSLADYLFLIWYVWLPVRAVIHPMNLCAR